MAAANYLRPKKAEREFVNFKKQQTPPSLWARAAFAGCIRSALPSPIFGVTIYTQASENNTYIVTTKWFWN